ncbi:MAG: hypothetical protein JXR96_06590 [Deltaproteobacteria bacterium]|nr:hypothetical protein [Deltaproteobacteria bacterium]
MPKVLLVSALALATLVVVSACGEDVSPATAACRQSAQIMCGRLDDCGYLDMAGYDSVDACYGTMIEDIHCDRAVWDCPGQEAGWDGCAAAMENMSCAEVLLARMPEECDLCS